MVEWKKLVSVSDVLYGYPFESSLFSENSNNIPLIRIRDVKPAKASTYYSGDIIENYIIKRGDILVGMDGEFNIGKWDDRDGLLNQRVLKLSGKDGLCLDGYLFHYMGPVFKRIEKETPGGSVKHLSAKAINNIVIPVPSMSHQMSIVEILDTFTSSIENLKEQIALRRKQYEYYRDQLLDLEGKEGVEMKTIGDLCDTLSGFPFDSSQFSETGIRLMRGMNVKRGCFDFNEDINKYWVNSVGLEKYLLNENDIIISMDGSLVGHSFCYLKKEHLPLLLVQRVARIRTTENFKFIYYNIAKSFPDYVDKKKTAGAIPHISMKDINGFTIPVPSPDEQQRIVDILDVFEESIQNLEAQLAGREKQYEYYRNKLLKFE